MCGTVRPTRRQRTFQKRGLKFPAAHDILRVRELALKLVRFLLSLVIREI